LVDDQQPALARLAEFVLGVDQDQAALGGAALAVGEEPRRDGRRLLEVLLGDRAAPDQLGRRDRLVVLALLGLGRRGQERRGQALVLLHALGQRVAAELARAALVGVPDRGGGHAGQVGAHDEL